MESDFKDLIRFEPGTHDLTADAIELIATVAAQKRDIDRAEKLIKAKLLGVMGANAVSNLNATGFLWRWLRPRASRVKSSMWRD